MLRVQGRNLYHHGNTQCVTCVMFACPGVLVAWLHSNATGVRQRGAGKAGSDRRDGAAASVRDSTRARLSSFYILIVAVFRSWKHL